MNSFLSKALKAINENSMIQKGDRVIVALSGGADSVSLFNVLLSLKDKLGFTVMATHINHNLRGNEAQRDEDFVKNLCKVNNVELFVKSVDVASLAQKEKISTELCGRNVRYDFFSQLHNKYNAKIATAHTASDNAETVIFNLVRGAGLKGVSGIVPKRDYIIRPLIYLTREQIEQYCIENNLTYVTDSTNLTVDYTRNKIRHNIIPKLKELNPNLEEAFLRNSKIFTQLNGFVSEQTDIAVEKSKCKNGYNIDYLNKLDDAVKTTALMKICKSVGAKPESCHIDSLVYCLENGGCVDIPPSVRAVCKQGVIRFVKEKAAEEVFCERPFSPSMNFTYNGKEYSAREIKDGNSKELISNLVFESTPIIRTRKQGDVFTLPYRNVTKSLKKLMIELKIPQEIRDSLLLVADGSTVLWCEGIGVSKQGMSNNNSGYKIDIKSI
jgi:tRNA(Ile)-lysidine synthase